MAIYLNFNEWFSRGHHGFSSCSRDLMQKIWDDLEPTMKANIGSLEQELIDRIRENEEDSREMCCAMYRYLEEVAPDKADAFSRWWLKESFKEIENGN